MSETQEDYNLASEAMWNADPSIPESEKFHPRVCTCWRLRNGKHVAGCDFYSEP